MLAFDDVWGPIVRLFPNQNGFEPAQRGRIGVQVIMLERRCGLNAISALCAKGHHL